MRTCPTDLPRASSVPRPQEQEAPSYCVWLDHRAPDASANAEGANGESLELPQLVVNLADGQLKHRLNSIQHQAVLGLQLNIQS